MKLISLNIEGDKHLERVKPFLEYESPDVICLQEVFENTASTIAALGYSHAFLPMTIKEEAGSRVLGTAIFVRASKTTTFHSFYYKTTPGELPMFVRGNQEETIRHGVVFARITNEEGECRIGSTHFTWVSNGEMPNYSQVRDMDALLTNMESEPAHILCGDFNIPRHHNRLYEKLITHYKDDVPREYASSLDKTLHRLGSDPTKAHIFDSFMVDYVFSQAPYIVSDVRLVFGVSDHAAVVAHVHA